MFDPTTYAITLFESADVKQYQDILYGLEIVSDLVRERQKIVELASSTQICALLNRHGVTCPTTLEKFLDILFHYHDIDKLPRITRSFERQLELHGIPVIHLTTAQNDPAIAYLVQERFGTDACIIQTTDPSLIAGSRLTTSTGSYEYSISARLHHLKQTLSQTGKDDHE